MDLRGEGRVTFSHTYSKLWIIKIQCGKQHHNIVRRRGYFYDIEVEKEFPKWDINAQTMKGKINCITVICKKGRWEDSIYKVKKSTDWEKKFSRLHALSLPWGLPVGSPIERRQASALRSSRASVLPSLCVSMDVPVTGCDSQPKT